MPSAVESTREEMLAVWQGADPKLLLILYYSST